jgi:hydrogenase maturation protease
MRNRGLRRGFSSPQTSLIIGYGSVLRGDDAAGARVAATVAHWALPGAQAIAAHQLTPELAEPLSRARVAVFVDARAGDGGGVRLRALGPRQLRATLDMHVSDPESLLALAHALYGRAPQAWLLTIPARQFELGAPLSPQTRRALPIARRRIRRLIKR